MENKYKLIDVDSGLEIQTPDGEILSVEQALVEILGKLDEIEKVVKK